MKIAIGSDHRGYEIKKEIINRLQKDYEILDLGTNSEESTDYPIYAFKVAEAVKNQITDFGILLCGTGIGMSIAANKVKGIRCARVVDKEEALLTRMHNNANIIALSANIKIDELIEIINVFLNTSFSNDERHIRRNNMVDKYES